MKTFSTTRTYNLKDLLRETSVTIIIIALIFAVVLLWFPERLTIFSLIVPVILLMKDFYDKASRRRLQRLTFDNEKKEIVVLNEKKEIVVLNEKKEIVVLFKSFFSDIRQIRLSYGEARLEVVEDKSKFKIFEPLTLYLMKEKMEVFELTKSKDRLSIDIMHDIVLTAESYAIPIIRK